MNFQAKHCSHWTPVIISVLASVGCGGGSGDGSGGGITSAALSPSITLAQQCDPSNPVAVSTLKTGSLDTEKRWVRSYFDENYLWYDQVPTVNPAAAAYSGPMGSYGSFNVPLPLANYFQSLKTAQLTPGAALLDRFSFTYNTQDWNALSQSGQSIGYGWLLAVAASTPPRKATVAYTNPGTPSANANVARGAQILFVDGVDYVNATSSVDRATLNAGLTPGVGTSHTFVVQDVGVAGTRTVTMTAQTVTSTPVQNVGSIATPSGKVGYLLFNEHIASSEALLINAINQLRTDGVTDLVLDIRYNGGGYLYVANALAFMIGGAVNLIPPTGNVFEKLVFNNKRSIDNAIGTTFFRTSACNLNNSRCAGGAPLPSLNLSRVFVLTQKGTCSASESIINGLLGANIDVKTVGANTCGKPYGFSAKDNCGVSYFPIEFKGVNAKGNGDYVDGFTASCTVADDYTKGLGDPSEGQLSAALQLRSTGSCPGGIPAKKIAAGKPSSAAESDLVLLKNPLLENRWLLP